MPYALIIRYSSSALLFALAVCGAWLLVRFALRRDRPNREDVPWLIILAYLAALTQIIGLRLGLVTYHPLGGELRLTPLYTTLEHWRHGPGSFIYHTVGNLIWFVPLGALLARRPRCRWWQALLAGAVVSLALETLQYLLGSGLSDVDDILFNALGALAGFALYRLLVQIVEAARHTN